MVRGEYCADLDRALLELILSSLLGLCRSLCSLFIVLLVRFPCLRTLTFYDILPLYQTDGYQPYELKTML